MLVILCGFHILFDDIAEGLFILLMVAMVLVFIKDFYVVFLVGVGVGVLGIPLIYYFFRVCLATSLFE